MDHDSAELADRGTILRCQVGSAVFGTSVDGQGDRDEMGLCVEPPEYVAGLRRFEQYVFRTQPEGVRSGPGDLDLIVYSLRKWMRLALGGNPTVLLPLFVPENEIVRITDAGRELRANADRFVSQRAGAKFAGYLQSQRRRLVEGTVNVTRPELVEAYGFDTKYAMHMVRLGVQGVELLKTGRLTLPMAEPWRTWLRDLRRGRHSRDDALAAAGELERELAGLVAGASPLPAGPDEDWADEFLVRSHLAYWA
ncbi:nucleotidyltransferase domain-containing protein [Amycolatopsis rhabdoformis]|uniref:Nucleotidyltransferase domain-containing protein n=1 Tax=Amycolatopsis rhabdoformis TaxID=1448059 RepID=A0ABZ1HZL1_9PSEU|nr:nucleotidyltransferase domain-containing protein [Amycolatopsis rhabdoformis]WSE27571.1 nucleotidyltransferase domain-containing protein [Amycolatopsis rhabdoformis]